MAPGHSFVTDRGQFYVRYGEPDFKIGPNQPYPIDLIDEVIFYSKQLALADELGINHATLYSWVRKYSEDKEEAFPGEGKLKPSDEEVRKLRRQLADVTEERDILKKAISIFSKDQKKSTSS